MNYKEFKVVFHEERKKRLGKVSVSKIDKEKEFKKIVRCDYTNEEIKEAINNFFTNLGEWHEKTGNTNETHFLRIENFARYLDMKPKKILIDKLKNMNL